MNKALKYNAGIAKMNFKSLLLSKIFYASIAANLAVLIMAYYFHYVQGASISDVCSEFLTDFYFGTLPRIVILISTLPVITSFCTDWNTQYVRSVAGRAGVERYLRHKILYCIAGTFITAFISLWLFTFFLRTRMPMITPMGAEELSGIYPFGVIVADAPYLYQLCKIICFSAYCSVWAVVGLAISAYIPNRFLVFTSPFTLCYILEIIFNNKIVLVTPLFLHIPYLALATMTSPLFGNPVIDLLYIVLLFFGLSLLAGKVFFRGAKRRINNEIV